MRVSAFLIVGSLIAAPVGAQTIDTYTLRTYAVGASSPLQTFAFVATSVVCNQTAPTSTSTVNPNKAFWDDPANTGKVCIWTDTGSGPLFSAPVGGSYEASITASNAAGESPESGRAPFSRLGVPAGRTGLRVVK